MENCKHCYCIKVGGNQYQTSAKMSLPHNQCCNCGNKQASISYQTS